MRGIDGLDVAAEVLKNPRDDGGCLDAGDDAQPATAAPAGLDLDGERPLEALRPGQGSLPVGGRYLAVLVGSGGAGLGDDPGRSGLAGANTP